MKWRGARLSSHLTRPHARPSSATGRVLGSETDIANRKPMQLALDLLDPKAGESILDAGCGTGASLAAIRSRAACLLTGVDPSATMLARARRRLGFEAQLLATRCEDIPLPDESFDAVLALNILHFDSEGQAVLQSLHRLLRPGGRLIACVSRGETTHHPVPSDEGNHPADDDDAVRETFQSSGFMGDRVMVQHATIARSTKALLVRAVR